MTSNLRAGIDVDRVAYEVTVDRQPAGAGLLPEGPEPLAFPAEIPLDGLPAGADVRVRASAFAGRSSDPIVSALAITRVAKDARLLLPLRLESSCARSGATPAPACGPEETCISGQCVSAFVGPDSLAPYEPGWWTKGPDACKPPDGGEPVVLVGQGQADYLSAEDGALAQVEAGPQGGHHVWIALRTKNLRQAGSITTLRGTVPELGLEIDPFRVIFSFDRDEGGFCKLYGLRFQIDGERPVEELLGRDLLVRVEVKDADGDVGSGERLFRLSDSVL